MHAMLQAKIMHPTCHLKYNNINIKVYSEVPKVKVFTMQDGPFQIKYMYYISEC